MTNPPHVTAWLHQAAADTRPVTPDDPDLLRARIVPTDAGHHLAADHCGAPAPTAPGGVTLTYCAHTAGHTGRHRGVDHTEWGPVAAGPYDAGDAPTDHTYRRVPTQAERLADARQAGHALPAGSTVPRSMYDEAVDAIALTERERDSLARRLGVRFGELEEARAARRQAEDERDRYAAQLAALRRLYTDNADGPPISGDWLMGQLRELTAEPDPYDHVLEVATADHWAIHHPDSCTDPADCPVIRLAYSDQAALVALPVGRYRVGVGDLRDRLLIGNRLEG